MWLGSCARARDAVYLGCGAGDEMRGMTGKRAIFAVLILALSGALASCDRNQYPLTACIDGKPAVERIKDAAPPNCAPPAG